MVLPAWKMRHAWKGFARPWRSCRTRAAGGLSVFKRYFHWSTIRPGRSPGQNNGRSAARNTTPREPEFRLTGTARSALDRHHCQEPSMYYIDPHIHMISRVTDDYQRMAQCGCVALSEPAFWAGFDRGSVEGFRDYFRHLTEFEPQRAAQFGIRHYSWLCINAKEAENVALSREVLAMIPELLNPPNV